MGVVNTSQLLHDVLRRACPDCWDTSIVPIPNGPVVCLPCMEAGKEFSPAAVKLANRVWMRVEKKMQVDAKALFVARLLVHASPEFPVTGPMLQSFTDLGERSVKAIVETLREEWHLPLVASRTPPRGYYYAATAEQYLAWFRTFRAQAVTELATGYHNLRANYPDLAGQDSLSFVTDFTRELQEALR